MYEMQDIVSWELQLREMFYSSLQEFEDSCVVLNDKQVLPTIHLQYLNPQMLFTT